MNHTLCILSLLAALVPVQTNAEVFFDPKAGLTSVTNQIKPQDYLTLRNIGKSIGAGKTWHVSLNSPGGDIETSLKMGRVLREHEADVNVGANAVCLSACVYLLAGAPRRSVQSHLGAKIGIHRAYAPNDQETTMQGQKRRQQHWEKHIKAFLGEVNVPESLYEEMLRISPGEIRILSPLELRKYSLSTNDPYWDDAKETEEAKEVGISRLEYMERKAKAKSICERYRQPGKEFGDLLCESNILRGFPPEKGLE